MRILLIILVIISASCKDMFDYSPYIVDFNHENSSVNSRNLKRLKEQATDDTITIAFTGDTHRFYDETASFVEHVNRRNNIDFVIHTGDFTDFGLSRQYEWGNKILLKLDSPYFVLIGNHDLIGNGSLAYEKMFGEMNFSFIYKRLKFILINTNSREYKFNGKIPDYLWLENELRPDADFDKAVVVFHVPPFDSDFDSSLEEVFHTTLSGFGNVLFSIHGHIHRHQVVTPYDDNIPFISTYAIHQKKYIVIQISKNEFNIEISDF